MTMVADFCSQIILQKSFTVSCLGPVGRGWSRSQTREVAASPRPVALAFRPRDGCSPPALRKGVMGLLVHFTPYRVPEPE